MFDFMNGMRHVKLFTFSIIKFTPVINLLRRMSKMPSSKFMNGYVVLRFVAAHYKAHMTKIEKGVDPR